VFARGVGDAALSFVTKFSSQPRRIQSSDAGLTALADRIML